MADLKRPLRQIELERRRKLLLEWADCLERNAAGNGNRIAWGFRQAIEALTSSLTFRQLELCARQLWATTFFVGRVYGFVNTPPFGCGRCRGCADNQKTLAGWTFPFPPRIWELCEAVRRGQQATQPEPCSGCLRPRAECTRQFPMCEVISPEVVRG